MNTNDANYSISNPYKNLPRWSRLILTSTNVLLSMLILRLNTNPKRPKIGSRFIDTLFINSRKGYGAICKFKGKLWPYTPQPRTPRKSIYSPKNHSIYNINHNSKYGKWEKALAYTCSCLEDKLAWRIANKHPFTIRSYYKSMVLWPPYIFATNLIWNPNIPSTVSYLVWVVAWLPTN